MPSTVTTWLVEPRDPLVFRDGRPALDGVPMSCLPFPWPSTIAGLSRTIAGSDEDGVFLFPRNATKLRELLEIKVQGPWMVLLSPQGEILDLAFPAPNDCIWFPNPTCSETWKQLPIRPTERKEGELSNLPGDLSPLEPVEGFPPRKPLKEAPSWWRYKDLKQWLQTSPEQRDVQRGFGLPPLPREERTHVAIDPFERTAIDGGLFSTESLVFHFPKQEAPLTKEAFNLGIAFACDHPNLRERPIHIGGERRISFLRKRDNLLPELPNFKNLGKRLRLVLATPAPFEGGFRPIEIPGATIYAAAVGRPQSISGWDHDKNAPKPCRRMAPAGSVYWIELDDDQNPEAWVHTHWMQSICESPQDQRDGFGLILIGVA